MTREQHGDGVPGWTAAPSAMLGARRRYIYSAQPKPMPDSDRLATKALPDLSGQRPSGRVGSHHAQLNATPR
jgi:hypothetical protein